MKTTFDGTGYAVLSTNHCVAKFAGMKMLKFFSENKEESIKCYNAEYDAFCLLRKVCEENNTKPEPFYMHVVECNPSLSKSMHDGPIICKFSYDGE